MNEINAASNPQEFYQLVKALKNSTNWQDKLVDNLAKIQKPDLPNEKKVRDNYIFKKHPDHFESNESLNSLNNDVSNKSIALIFQKGFGMSDSQSDENLFDTESPLHKNSGKNCFTGMSSMEISPVPVSYKKQVRIKKPQNMHKNHDDLTTARSATDKIGFERKLESVLCNILSSSEKIRLVMNVGITPPDGDEEWERRYSRAKEFYSRFSRNYSYRLGRQITDLENCYIRGSGKSSNRTVENIQHRLLAVFNVILNALQAYYSHMPTSLAYVAIDKLMSLYENICKCGVIINKFIHREDENVYKFDLRIEEVLNVSKDMVDKLSQILFEIPQLYCLTLSAAKSMRKGYKWQIKLPTRKKPVKKTHLDARLSMYSISSIMRPKTGWKKTIEDLTNNKMKYNHVQSRYKTAVFKHRVPPEKQLVSETSTKLKIFEKKSSTLLRNTPLLTPNKDDDIVTMVELDYKREKDPHKLQRVSPSTSNEKVCKSKQFEDLTPLVQGLCHKICTQDGKNVSEDKLEGILMDFLGKALDGKINTNNIESISTKNETTKYAESLVEPLELNENNEYQADINLLDVIENTTNSDKADKDLHSYVDFIKNVRLKLEGNNSHDKRKKMKSCTSLMESIESTSNCNSNKLGVENQHKVTFRDDSKIVSNREKQRNYKLDRRKRQQTISVTGEKNAQLICIQDDSSIVEISENDYADKSQNTSVNTPNKCLHEVEVNDCKRSCNKDIKISRRSKKLLRKLELLPNTIVYEVIKYKISYKKYSNLNPMYRKLPTTQPWDIVELISENLLNDLLLNIAKEIEETDLLKNIYESEFY